MDLAVDILHRYLTDKILVKSGCRLHLKSETVIQAQRVHLISR